MPATAASPAVDIAAPPAVQRVQGTMAAITIRSARLSDAAAISSLTAQLGYDLPESDATSRLSRLLSDGRHDFLVAESGALVVGWLHAAVVEYIEVGAFVIVGGLVVDRAHRGQGIGRMLMAEAEGWARAQGCSLVRLWSTSARTAAHRFYEALGYTKVKTQFSFVKSLDPSRREDLSRFVPRVEE